MDDLHVLTPAGQQVEQALLLGYPTAAARIYYLNLRENVPMVEGDEPSSVSVWPEWHRRIHSLMDDPEVVGEAVAREEADRLGLTGEEREDFTYDYVEDVNAMAPSIIEVAVRDIDDRVIGTEWAPNPAV